MKKHLLIFYIGLLSILPGLRVQALMVVFHVSADNGGISTTGTPAALSTISGFPSSSTNFKVSGTQISVGIRITPPAGFEVSTDNINFESSVSITGSGNIPATTIYLRLKAIDAAGTYSGDILLESPSGTTSVNLATTASTVAPANTGSPNISYSGPQHWVLQAAITPLTPANIGGAVTGINYKEADTEVVTGLSIPRGIAMDAADNIYVTQQTGGIVSKFPAGGGAPVTLASGLNMPHDITVDAAGNVYVLEFGAGDVKKIPVGGGAPVTVISGLSSPNGMVVDAVGNLYVGDTQNNLVKKVPAGGGAPLSIGSGFNAPNALAIDAAGNLYIGDSGNNNSIKKIPAGSSTPVTIATGIFAYSLAVNTAGDLFTADGQNIWEIPVGATPRIIIPGSVNASLLFDAQDNLYYSSTLGANINKRAAASGYQIVPALPAGLNIDKATGVISGTPNAASPATNYTITAYNIMGSSSTTLNIAAGSLLPNPDANGIMYVKKGSSGNGSSWANALGEVADALKAAKTNTNIKQIWVAAGTYLPQYSPEDGANFGTDKGRDNAFLLVSNVKLYGGFAGTERAMTDRVPNTNTSTLSGDFNGDDVVTGSGNTLSITNNTENAYHVVISAGGVGTALLDGFTIKGGNGNGSSSGITVNTKNINRSFCSGMFNSSSSPTLTNVIISGNVTNFSGGGMYNMLSSSPTLTNVIIRGNKANDGGGMSNSSSSPILTNVSIIGNASGTSGGGMSNSSSSPTLTNVTISGNTASTSGSQLYYESGTITAKNTIIFGPEASAVFSSGGNLTASYSLIKSINSTDNNNVSASGLTIFGIFNDPTTGDYTLKPGSPAIDKGSNALFAGLNANTTDLAGNPRAYNYSTGGLIDIGAYEYQGSGSQTITFNALPAKTYGDGDFTLSASSTNPAVPITFASSNLAVATVNGNTVTIVGVGTTTITASQAGDASHPAAADVPQLLTVNKAGQTITFNTLPSKTFGDAPFIVNATSTNNAIPITFTSSNPAVATVNGNMVTIVGAGTTIITASQMGDANYNAAADVQRVLNVSQVSATVITFVAPPSKTFGDADFTLSASSTNPVTLVTFASSNTAVATVNGNTVTIIGAGTTTITASQGADANHPAATDQTQLLTVNKADQVITFVALPLKKFGDADFTVSASSTNPAVPVTFTSSSPAVATVNGNAVHIVSSGTTAITANQAGDANHNAAMAVQRTLNVGQAGAPIITFTALPVKTYGDANFALSASSTNPAVLVTFVSSNPAVATINGNTITIVGAGTTTITAKQPADANHPAATDVPQLLTVNKVNQVITFAALPSKTFGDADFTITATSTNPAIPITFTSSDPAVATVSGNTVHIVSSGSSIITASQAGDANHNAAMVVQRTLNVGQTGAPVITFAALPTKTYGDADFNISASSTNPAVPITFASSNTAVATVTGNTVTIIGAGTTTITASQASDANHPAATDQTQLLTVNKADQVITFAALPSKLFGDADFTISATSTNNAIPITFTSSSPAVATVNGNTVHIVSSGTTAITANQAGDANHNAATAVQWTLNVGQAEAPVITFAALPTKTYGDVDFTITAASTNPAVPVTFTSSNPAVAMVNGNTVTIVGVGTTTIIAKQPADANHPAATDVPQLLTVNKAGQTITFNILQPKTFGDADFTITATSTNNAIPITFTSSNPSIATVNGNTVHIISSGSSTITASQAGDANHNAAADVQRVLNVGQAGTPVITFAALSAKTFGDADFTISASSTNPAVSITFTSSNTAVATVTGNTVTIIGAGTTTITASQAGDANHPAATNQTQVLTVNKADQVITFAPLPSKTFGDPDFNITATSTNNAIPIIFTSSNIAVATVTGNAVRIVSSGSTTITASQTGDANHNAATTIQRTLNVGQAGAPIITFTALPTKTYGDADFTISANSTNPAVPITFTSSNPVVATISGNTVTIVGVGTTTITASQAGDANHPAATDQTQLLTVNKAGQTVTFAALPSKTFGDADFTINASSNNPAIPVTFTSSNTAVATVTGNTIHIVSSGTTIITASQVGDANHNAATAVQRTLNIGQAGAPVITFAALPTKTYGNADFTISANSTNPAVPITFTSSNPVVATISGNTVTIVGVGTTTITASQAGDANHPAATDQTQLLTVNKAGQTVTFAALPSKTFGDADFTINASSNNPSIPVTFTSSNTAVATVNGNTVTIVNAGTTTITASQVGDANHNAATAVQRTLNVGQAGAPVMTFVALPAKTYGDANFTLSASSTNAAVPIIFTSSNLAVATVNGNTVTIVGAGTTTITASQAGDSNHPAAVDVPQLLTVNKANQVITFGPLPSKTFGDADFALNANTTNAAVPITFASSNTAVATVNGNTIRILSAGTTTITASQAGDANHNAATVVQRTLNVGQASAPVITFAALPTKTYGDADFTISASSTNPAVPVTFVSSNTAVATISGSTITILSAGTTTITASQAGDANHSAATNVPKTFTISQRPITVTADAQTKTYNVADPALTYKITTGALVGTDKFTGALIRAAGENVGTYGIQQGTLALNSNYVFTYIGADLTVTQRILTITANNASKTYGSANPVLNINYNGFVNGDNGNSLTTQPVIATTATPSSSAGTYPITVSGAAIANYKIVYTAGTLTVNKATLTIMAEDKNRLYGVANPTFSVVYNGFVNGDDQAALTKQPVLATVANSTSLPGLYPIMVNGATSPNYAFNYAPGKLTVIALSNAKLINLIPASGTLTPSFNSDNFSYNVQVDNGIQGIRLTLTFDPTATATINGSSAQNDRQSFSIPLNIGNNTISVEVTAQDRTTKKTYTLAIYRGENQKNIVASNILTPNGDGKNDTWVIDDIQLFPNNTVTVFDKAGRTVYTKHGYTNDWNGTYGGAALTEGTYYYIVELGPLQRKFKGFITIIHNR